MSLPPFQRLIDQHGPAVFRYLAARSGSDAEDCYQETLLAAFRGYDQLKDGTHLRSWLFTIARNKVIDRHRARSRSPEPTDLSRDEAVWAQAEGDPAAWSGVRALPAGQRDAVFLRYGADLSYAEIGRIVGCSEAAARRRAADGIARLRKETA